MYMLVYLYVLYICVDISEFIELLMKYLVMQFVLSWLCVFGCNVNIMFWLFMCSSCVVRFSSSMFIISVISDCVEKFSGSYDVVSSISVSVVVRVVLLWLVIWFVMFVVNVFVVFIRLNSLIVVLLQWYGVFVSRKVSGVQNIVNIVKFSVLSSVCRWNIGFFMNNVLIECSSVLQFRFVC